MTNNPRFHYEKALRQISEGNELFMEMVNDKENPMTREDLEAMLERRPGRWERFRGFLETLPTREEVAQRSNK